MKRFGLILREILRVKKMTQMDAAAALKVSQNTISYYCNADRFPRPHMLKFMAARLGVAEGELRGEEINRVREAAAPYDISVEIRAMRDLKQRWQSATEERRQTMAVDLRRLHPRFYSELLDWLNDSRARARGSGPASGPRNRQSDPPKSPS